MSLLYACVTLVIIYQTIAQDIPGNNVSPEIEEIFRRLDHDQKQMVEMKQQIDEDRNTIAGMKIELVNIRKENKRLSKTVSILMAESVNLGTTVAKSTNIESDVAVPIEAINDDDEYKNYNTDSKAQLMNAENVEVRPMETDESGSMNAGNNDVRSMDSANSDDVITTSNAEHIDTAHKIRQAERISTRQSRIRYKRVAPIMPIAFHAVMTKSATVVPGNTLVYDSEVLDQGNAYNPSEGIYVVPEFGTYVITWTTLTAHDYLQTLLVVNGATKGSSMTDSQEVNDVHQSTAVAVLTLNQGDHVVIKAGTIGHGVVHSSEIYGKPTFSVWKLFAM